jgi:2-hydroxychromene-2-carboxylate isomerase
MIRAYIDFKSLECFLAIEPIIALAKEFGVAIDWQPFSSRPRALPTQVDDETVTQTHHRVRAESEHRLRLHYASVRGYKITTEPSTQDSTKALMRLSQISGDRTEFVKQAFEACWLQNKNLDDTHLLDQICLQASVVHNTTKNDLEESQKAAEEAGLFDAPTFAIDEQLFMGRAHIPWMRELLQQA